MGKPFQIRLIFFYSFLFVGLLFTTISCNSTNERSPNDQNTEESSLVKDSLVYRIIIDDDINPSVSRLVRRGRHEDATTLRARRARVLRRRERFVDLRERRVRREGRGGGGVAHAMGAPARRVARGGVPGNVPLHTVLQRAKTSRARV